MFIIGAKRWWELEKERRTALVVQWLRTRLPMLGTWGQSLVGELRAHAAAEHLRPCTATEPTH